MLGLTPFEKAKNYCFLLLKFRLRSENELRSRLKKKKFDEPVIRKAIDFLKEKKFIDDAAFARGWADSRLKKGMGARRIAQELALKGIDKRLIEGEVARIKEDYPETETALEIARRRKEKMKDVDPQKIRQRIYGYLIRRGFSPDVVIDVVNEL
ncbi:MAG: regulatory protein RecX [Candidatus Omnitrophota bacterium]